VLRFVPDHWLDGLLRPLLLADPLAGLYVETNAPDWRFAIFTVFIVLILATHRRLTALDPWQWRLLLGCIVSFYLWTFLSGNGRYVIWALLLIGPFLVLAASRLKTTIAMRNTLILGALSLQGWSTSMTYETNLWALRPWTQAAGLGLADTPMSAKPAVFLTLGFISHSILVPQMHPLSRWSNIAGQHEYVPGTQNHSRFQALMASELPKYAVVRAANVAMAPDGQPLPEAWAVIHRALAMAGLVATAQCHLMRSEIGGVRYTAKGVPPTLNGFWFCPVQHKSGSEPRTEDPSSSELNDVFDAVERHCPRMLPPGSARTRQHDDGVSRFYIHSDTTVVVRTDGHVTLKYMRALNPSHLGTVEDIRAARFSIDCERLPGRYAPPWARN